VAVVAALQAGTIFYIVGYFMFLQEKYQISDEIFDWFDYAMNIYSLFGIIPGLVIMRLKPKKSAVIGSVMIMLGYLLFSSLVSFDKAHITKNATFLLRIVVVLCG
jgi:hypothetical protein